MSANWMALSAGWRRRPESAEDAARRLYRMLTTLRAIDGRFANLLEGGSSPNPARGWRLLEVSEEALTALLQHSDRNASKPDYTGVVTWVLGAWNGRRDDGTSVGISAVVEGPIADPFGLRSHVAVDSGVDGLSREQVEAIVGAVMDAWDPDEATRKDRIDGTEKLTHFARGEGWSVAD